MSERLRPETVAVTLAQHAHDTEPEPQAYLARVVDELFSAEPGVLDHIVDKWFSDLLEELGRRGQQGAVEAAIEVWNHWNQEV
jgi:hypothetical protein